MTIHDYYQILSLPFSGSTSGFTKQQLKLAYHKALLTHHPDKASPSTPPPTTTKTHNHHLPHEQRIYTIDEITTAYKTLSDPHLRAEYDRALRLDRSRIAEREKSSAVFHTGLEVVDLEDLGCDETGDGGDDSTCVWFRACRCGDDRGFLVSESDLEREAEHGEIVVGCRGCSLWMKVLFAVAEDT
ncbi:CSL zinc finger-domain-containing protein [Aspergillus ambiguus]|uniref:CSL zinc finger-domain-containing protein n=1 Tax=Aspergillus ambiguus TaxID=176160 RepID=UPI003CCCF2BB